MARWTWAARASTALALLVGLGGVAWGGALDATLTGSTRGVELHLAFYPPTPRAAAMGNAHVALSGVDSHNPAAWAFAEGPDVGFDVGRLDLARGSDLTFCRGHAVVPLLGGYAKLMGLSLSTRDMDPTPAVGGAELHFWGREFGAGYGRELPLPDAIPGRLAVGAAGFPNDPSEVRIEPAGGGGRLGHGRGQSQIGSVRLGLMYKPFEESDLVTVGAQYTHIKDFLWASYEGFGVGRRSDTYYVNLYTVGAAVKPMERTTLAVSHLTGSAHGQGLRSEHGSPRGKYNAFSVGAEHILPVGEEFAVALRAGMLRGEFTCGVGLQLPMKFRVDYAFMQNYGHHLRKVFGRDALHIIGVGKSF